MLIKYKIISYDNYIDPEEKISSQELLDDNMLFVDAIHYIVGKYNKEYLNKQIYIQDLCELTWGKYFDFNFIMNSMEIDSYHYKWLKNTLLKVNESFHLFDNVINIIIDGPGVGLNLGEKEGIKFKINTNEAGHEYLPHVHVEYSGEEIRISLIDLQILDGKGFSNRRKTKIAIEFVKNNREMLLEKWTLLTNYKVPIIPEFYV